jgi:ATP-dependent Clp protease ATP-binding subunit ClpC
MGVLKGHFRPEFLNRIDDIIVFHALTRDNIRSIVSIQLDRVIRTASAQNITVKIDDSLIDHLADVGYQPEFGARELKRQIRQAVETRLAKEMLAGKLQAGDSVELGYDTERREVVFNKVEVDAPKTSGKSSPPDQPDDLAPTAETGT